jgi:hypothetical protein
LYVSGPEAKVARFRGKAVSLMPEAEGRERELLSFENFYPTPEELNSYSSMFYDEYDSYYGDANRVLNSEWFKSRGITTQEEMIIHLDEFFPDYRIIADQTKARIDTYGFPGWYQWRWAKWGTKWDACECTIITNEPCDLLYAFTTAWTPPGLWLAHIVKDFPDLYFKLTFEEPGCDGTGYSIYKHSEVVEDVLVECWQGVHPDEFDDVDIDEVGFDFNDYTQSYGYISDPNHEVLTEDNYRRAVAEQPGE